MIKVKKHVFTQGNISAKNIDKAIKEHYPNGIDFCYTDPPWGTGNLNYWKTINKKMNDGLLIDQIDQQELEERIVPLICNNVNNYAFIVYGVREAQSIMDKFKANPKVIDVQYIEKKYKSGNKWMKNCVIAITFKGSVVHDFTALLSNENGIKGLVKVCELLKGDNKSVLELFVGIGYYLKVLDKYGFNVIGNELNLSRLQKAIGKINK